MGDGGERVDDLVVQTFVGTLQRADVTDAHAPLSPVAACSVEPDAFVDAGTPRETSPIGSTNVIRSSFNVDWRLRPTVNAYRGSADDRGRGTVTRELRDAFT